MKKKIFVLFFALIFVLCIGTVVVLATDESNETPTLNIAGFSLSLKESIFINCKVSHTNIDEEYADDIQVLVWEEVPEAYTVNNNPIAVLPWLGTDKSGYESYRYTNITAKEMTKELYFCAYVKVGDTEIYSAPKKYSILTYAYNKINTTSPDEKLVKLCQDLLDYGASAQTYSGYNTDFLANDEVYKITVSGGTLADGFTSGIYQNGDTVVLTANAPEDGYEFFYWKNSLGRAYATSTISVEVIGKETYTAVYKETGGSGTLSVDFNGYKFTFATHLSDDSGWEDYEVYGDESCSTIINTAITERNDSIKELYNCDIEVIEITNGVLANDFATGQHNVDFASQRNNFQYKTHDDYYNFHEMGLDLTQPWWNTNFIDDATVDGQLYGILGAFSLSSFDATEVIYFNKTVLDNNDSLSDIDLYELINSNEWTLDKFYEIIKKAGCEDGDQTMVSGTSDIFGFVSARQSITSLYFGAGQKYLQKTTYTDGTSEFNNAFNNAAITVTDKMLDIYCHEYVNCFTNETVNAQMENNLTLFASGTLKMAYDYADASVSYGILPYPKLNVEQESYSHIINDKMLYLAVPKTTTDIAMISQFLELYAAHSYSTVYPAYLQYHTSISAYDKTANMLSIILDSHTFDLAHHCDWAEIDGFYTGSVLSGTNSIAEFKVSKTPEIIEIAESFKEYLSTGTSATFEPIYNYEINSDGKTCTITDVILGYNKSIVIPSTIGEYTVTSIGANAFEDCTNLSGVTIPNSITSIGAYAFANCTNLSSVTVPSSITQFSQYCFHKCENLKTVYYTGTLEQWCNSTFEQYYSNPCGYGASLYINGELVSSLTIPSTLTEIKELTFAGCTSITSVTIPSNITSIGSLVFWQCSSLENIVFNGTMEQWNNIVLGKNWNFNIPATTITCTDGTVTIS